MASDSNLQRHCSPAPQHPVADSTGTDEIDRDPHDSESNVEPAMDSPEVTLSPSSEQKQSPPPPPSSADPDNDEHQDASTHQHRDNPGEADSATNRPDTPPIQQETSKHRRFSILRFRNASDSQLSLRVKQQAEKPPPPVPRPPAIITTTPPNEAVGPKKKTSRMSLAARFRRSNEVPRDGPAKSKGQGLGPLRPSVTEDPDRHLRPNSIDSRAYLHEAHALQPSRSTEVHPSRLRRSDSIRSESSSHAPVSQPNLNTPAKRSQTSSSSFKLRRSKKPPDSLLPFSRIQKTLSDQPSSEVLPTAGQPAPLSRPSSAHSAMTPRAGARFKAGGETLARQSSSVAIVFAQASRPLSGQSSPARSHRRTERSSTMSSAGPECTDDHLLPPTARTSTSTGRKSFGDLFGLSRIRQTSKLSRQGSSTPGTQGSLTSKSNSLQLPRGFVTLPERLDEESPAKYLARVEEMLSQRAIASALSKGSDTFSAAVLRSYMRSFSFFGDPIDMAIRKLLMEAELPKETQQIDRCLQAFANRYHECNPGIFSSPDQAYFIAFSLLILHTDVFNKKNKHKMQKSDYLKNTRGEGIFDDILECFYDNISYTPFIHVEDDLEAIQDRAGASKSKKKRLMPPSAAESSKRGAREPLDPYTLILDGKLDGLRPNLKDAMQLDDHYDYLGTANSLNLADLQKNFFRTAILQIVSARSRPDAFMSETTAANPEGAHPGIVDIKITKVGLLWRKDTKKKARSPWQEMGAILTGAQLYFFRNTSWVKGLMHQYENHIRAGHDGIPLIFKPPLEEFKPDALVSTKGAVALHDRSYKKHKHAFIYVKQAGIDEVLLADNEEERNDWLAKLNYAATFRTSGVRMRGLVGGGHLEYQDRRAIRRPNNADDAAQQVQTPTGPVSIVRGVIDPKMVEDIHMARLNELRQRIAEADRKLEEAHRRLEEQLRNARHLQVLAPIQSRTREQLLLAAARISAQLKCTRMDIWKEKCHRDILIKDLDDEAPSASPAVTRPHRQGEADPPLSATPRPSSSRRGSKATQRSPRAQNDAAAPCDISSTADGARDADVRSHSSSRSRPPSSVLRFNGFNEPSKPASAAESGRRGSVSSIPISPLNASDSAPQVLRATSSEGMATTSSNRADAAHDDMNAGERDVLEQTDLWEESFDTSSQERGAKAIATEDEPISLAEREKLEGNKIRRSLHRTLRESAGHLPYPRGRKAKDSLSGKVEDGVRDITLFRSTGSFVHGKKASVINLGDELQVFSHDERMLARRQSQQQQQQPHHRTHEGRMQGQPCSSPTLTRASDDDAHPATQPLAGVDRWNGRRESAASASTATARSFQELHRKYSAQAARSVSAGGRLMPTSDGESESAVSFSDGRRSPLPLVRRGSRAERRRSVVTTSAPPHAGDGIDRESE